MYIEFNLPKDASGLAAQHALGFIRRALHRWSDRYEIPYTTQIDEHTYRIQFDSDDIYSFFAISWNPVPRLHSTSWKRIKIVDAELPEKFTKDSENV